MALDGGNQRRIAGAADCFPPDSDFLILPLNLRSQLARFDIGGDDLIVIDGMPEDAELTAGAKKPDGSWSLRELDLDGCSFMPLYGNGETYTLRVCILTPDPSDHGLAKTKGKVDVNVEVPLTPLPILEAFDDAAVPALSPTVNTVILLPADPKLTASDPAAAPFATPAPSDTVVNSPPKPVVSSAATATATRIPAESPQAPAISAPARPESAQATPKASRGSFDQQLAKLRSDWRANVARQVAAAEQRLKASHLAQMSKIQRTGFEAPIDGDGGASEALAGSAPTVDERLTVARAQWQAEHDAALAKAREDWRSEEAARIAAAEAEWRAEAMQQRIALEARMADAYKERLAAVEGALAATTNPPPTAATTSDDWSVRLERALGDAQVGWEAEEAERRGKLEADLSAAHVRHIAEIEAQQAALYDMRLAAAEAAWRKAEAERLVAAEAAWSVGEAERLAASEAKWRTEHDKKLEVVLASFGAMVKGQLGAMGDAPPLPAIEPAEAPAAAPQPRSTEIRPAEGGNADKDLSWRDTAAA